MKRFNFFRLTLVFGILLLLWWNDVYMSSGEKNNEPQQSDEVYPRDSSNIGDSYFANS